MRWVGRQQSYLYRRATKHMIEPQSQPSHVWWEGFFFPASLIVACYPSAGTKVPFHLSHIKGYYHNNRGTQSRIHGRWPNVKLS